MAQYFDLKKEIILLEQKLQDFEIFLGLRHIAELRIHKYLIKTYDSPSIKKILTLAFNHCLNKKVNTYSSTVASVTICPKLFPKDSSFAFVDEVGVLISPPIFDRNKVSLNDYVEIDIEKYWDIELSKKSGASSSSGWFERSVIPKYENIRKDILFENTQESPEKQDSNPVCRSNLKFISELWIHKEILNKWSYREITPFLEDAYNSLVLKHNARYSVGDIQAGLSIHPKGKLLFALFVYPSQYDMDKDYQVVSPACEIFTVSKYWKECDLFNRPIPVDSFFDWLTRFFPSEYEKRRIASEENVKLDKGEKGCCLVVVVIIAYGILVAIFGN